MHHFSVAAGVGTAGGRQQAAVGSRAARRVDSPPHRARRPAGWRLPSSATRERVFDEQNVDGT
eukprot:COSAG01_NODE_48700_length_378_cov_23.835125_1_plen_62_part_10